MRETELGRFERTGEARVHLGILLFMACPVVIGQAFVFRNTLSVVCAVVGVLTTLGAYIRYRRTLRA